MAIKNKKRRIVLIAAAALIVLLIAIGKSKSPEGVAVTLEKPCL